MTDPQLVLVDLVRSYAAQLRPGDREAAARGTAVAVRALIEGASVAEAYAAGRQLVRSWARHPSRAHVDDGTGTGIRLAS